MCLRFYLSHPRREPVSGYNLFRGKVQEPHRCRRMRDGDVDLQMDAEWIPPPAITFHRMLLIGISVDENVLLNYWFSAIYRLYNSSKLTKD